MCGAGKARRQHQFSWHWGYNFMWITTWSLGTEPLSHGVAACISNHWATLQPLFPPLSSFIKPFTKSCKSVKQKFSSVTAIFKFYFYLRNYVFSLLNFVFMYFLVNCIYLTIKINGWFLTWYTLILWISDIFDTAHPYASWNKKNFTLYLFEFLIIFQSHLYC